LVYSGVFRFNDDAGLGQRTTGGQRKIDVRIAKAPKTTYGHVSVKLSTICFESIGGCEKCRTLIMKVR